MSFAIQPQTFFSIGPSRTFAGISGYVTINENTVDALEITQHPVQQGATISDHAFKKPVSFSMQILFESTLFTSLATIYKNLLALQTPVPPNVLTPFNVVTPKRTYYNMLLASLACTTDKKTENILAISASFQEVIIVPVTSTLVPRSQLKNPGSNGGTQSAGSKSALLTGVQAFAPGVSGVSQ
jgi:hypothetical protein